MELEIPLEVIARTTQCPKNFACLSQPVQTVCKVEYCVNGLVDFVECKTATLPCEYKIPYGYTGNICLCPTRQEIYKRYNL